MPSLALLLLACNATTALCHSYLSCLTLPDLVVLERACMPPASRPCRVPRMRPSRLRWWRGGRTVTLSRSAPWRSRSVTSCWVRASATGAGELSDEKLLVIRSSDAATVATAASGNPPDSAWGGRAAQLSDLHSCRPLASLLHVSSAQLHACTSRCRAAAQLRPQAGDLGLPILQRS